MPKKSQAALSESPGAKVVQQGLQMAQGQPQQTLSLNPVANASANADA
jgi:hypothetical protein